MLRILVVDDEAPIREWIVYCIEKAGQSFSIVGVAKSGKEAYTMALEHKPNVIITDIKMPGMDGIELVKLVKEVLPYTVFIILTNYAEFSYAKKAITYGAKEYLLKSELRSIDLISLLEDVLKTQNLLIEGKKEEVFSSGYIDLFKIYQNYENKDFAISFWEELGMDKTKPYGIISVLEDPAYKQRDILMQISMSVSPDYINIALRNDVLYVVLQGEDREALRAQINEVSRLYFKAKRQNIGLGQPRDRLEDVIEAFEESHLVLLSTFFNKEEGIVDHSDLLEASRLDYELVQKEYRNILLLLSLKRYEEVKRNMHTWFSHFEKLNIKDIGWSKRMCMKMVNSIEDECYGINHEYKDYAHIVKYCNSMHKCKERSLSLIKKISKSEEYIQSKSISKALKFIHENYSTDISLVKVSNHVYLSPEYFSRRFKEEVGTNFSVYLMMYRLKCAEKLLKKSDLKISQIAYESGYTSPGYFSRTYKKYTGMTPEEARSQYNTKSSK